MSQKFSVDDILKEVKGGKGGDKQSLPSVAAPKAPPVAENVPSVGKDAPRWNTGEGVSLDKLAQELHGKEREPAGKPAAKQGKGFKIRGEKSPAPENTEETMVFEPVSDPVPTPAPDVIEQGSAIKTSLRKTRPEQMLSREEISANKMNAEMRLNLGEDVDLPKEENTAKEPPAAEEIPADISADIPQDVPADVPGPASPKTKELSGNDSKLNEVMTSVPELSIDFSKFSLDALSGAVPGTPGTTPAAGAGGDGAQREGSPLDLSLAATDSDEILTPPAESSRPITKSADNVPAEDVLKLGLEDLKIDFSALSAENLSTDIHVTKEPVSEQESEPVNVEEDLQTAVNAEDFDFDINNLTAEEDAGSVPPLVEDEEDYEYNEESGGDDTERADIPLTENTTYTREKSSPRKANPLRKNKRKVRNNIIDFSASEENTPEGEGEVIDDYRAAGDASSIDYDLRKSAQGVANRFVLTLLTFILSFVVTVLPLLGSAIGIISPEENFQNFVIASTAILLIAAAVNISAILRGFTSLIAFNPDDDSAVSLVFLATLIQGVTAYFVGEPWTADSRMPLFAPAAILLCVFSLAGKKSMMTRIRRNFKFVATTTVKQSSFVADEKMSELMVGDDFLGLPKVACSKSVINLQNFLKNSYSPDISDIVSKHLASICLIVSLACLVLAYATQRDIMRAVSYFTAIAVMGAPVTALLAANLPLKSAAKKVRERGGMLSGYAAVSDFSDVDCVTVEAEELFPAGSVNLLSLRAVGDASIEDVILKSAALTIYAGGPLADVFDKIIDGRKKMLPDVTDAFYEDGMGLCGKIDGTTVRVGNRLYMENSGVQGLLTNDVDQKAQNNDAFIVYTAIDENVCGMFAVNYTSLDADLDESVFKLIKNGVSVAVKSNDPNVTPQLLSRVFEVPSEYFIVMSSDMAEHYEDITTPTRNGEGAVAYNNNVSALSGTLVACRSLKVKARIGVILQTVFAVAGLAAVIFAAVLAAISEGDTFTIINPANMILFQMASAVITLSIPAIIKN